VRRLLQAMHHSRADFTLTFRRLADVAENPSAQTRLRELFASPADLDSWLEDWRQRLSRDPRPEEERAASMRAVNPAFIPRNHRVEAALSAAEAGDYAPWRVLLRVLQHPYDDQPDSVAYARPPEPAERVLHTFCGT
jgi:uncharacterized protein YdiU (UPF0061 family)